MSLENVVNMETTAKVYVDNKTNETIENLKFTFHGEKTEDSFIEKLDAKTDDSKFTRKIIHLRNKNMMGLKPYIMYHQGKNNIKHEYVIIDKLNYKYSNTTRVEILKVKDDGSFEIKIDLDFDDMV